jgi:hypothetical protein
MGFNSAFKGLKKEIVRYVFLVEDAVYHGVYYCSERIYCLGLSYVNSSTTLKMETADFFPTLLYLPKYE